jgi:rfaE bifunctional protein nucleotidyltransferase chain/domain
MGKSRFVRCTPFDSGQNRAVNCREKILPVGALAAWRDQVRAGGRKLVVTNGCFDLLHAGHVTYLEAARKLGDVLLVGLNGDASVRQLKGEGRPINTEADRALVLAALASVDAVCIFQELDAQRFLTLVKPDIYAKGGDYTIDTINQPERRLVESLGGRVIVVAGVLGRSTSWLAKRLASS